MLGFGPISSGPISEIRNAIVTETTTRTMRFASKSFVTRETDGPANEYIPGRIARGLRLERRLNIAEDGQFGALIETNFGEIELNNTDGALDHLVGQYAADGRQIRLKIGATEFDSLGRERVQPFANFALVYTSVGGDWTFERDTVRLRIESLTSRLQNRLQPDTYAGTGDAEGTSDMAGRTKPTAFGECFNITTQIVDPAILTYQVHAGTMSQVLAVYDQGIEVTFAGTDYPTYADLAAATIPAGQYATCLAAGFIRLGSIPTGAITADVKGDIDNTSGNYVGTSANIIRMIARDYGGILSSEIDHTSFNTMTAAQGSEIGLFLPAGDQSTVLEVMERIAFGAGAFIGQDRSGLFRIQRLEPPSTTTVHWSFTDRDIVENGFERLALPYRIPWKSWGVGYLVNWTEQGAGDLAGGVTQARRQFLQSTRRYVYVQDVDIALFHATSSGAPLREGLFDNQASAETEAQRLQDLYNYGRALYRVVVKTALFSVEIGQTVRITYNRFDLAGGKNFVVVGIEDDADRVESALTVFG